MANQVMPSASTEALAKQIAKDSLKPTHGLTLPSKIARGGPK
jgi:hypothetical protein